MGQTCTCKSMLTISNAEIRKSNELSSNDSQNSSLENCLEVHKSSTVQTQQQYPQRFIIIYPTRKENFDNLRNELNYLNKDASFIIQECENMSINSNFSQEISSYLPSSLKEFRL